MVLTLRYAASSLQESWCGVEVQDEASLRGR